MERLARNGRCGIEARVSTKYYLVCVGGERLVRLWEDVRKGNRVSGREAQEHKDIKTFRGHMENGEVIIPFGIDMLCSRR